MTKMTRFEFFESGQALAGARIGIVPIDMLVKYDVYKAYLEIQEAGARKAVAIVQAAAKCGCDRSTVARYIYWFERDDDAFQDAAHQDKPQLATFVSK